MRELKKSDLQIGDILIFEDFDFQASKLKKNFDKNGFKGAFYYLLHYLIAWFDPGKEGNNYRNIYHAGIWGNVNVNRDKELPPSFEDCVVQAGTSGIGHASLEATLSHETVMNVYVCRLKEKTDNFETEINDSVREFYKVKGHYSFKTAWLLAVICSLRYSKGTLRKLLRKRFGYLAAHYMVKAILDQINEYNDHHQRDMVACSPLVAMMYKNAGHELPVKVFQVLQDHEEVEPKFDLDEIKDDLDELLTTDDSDEWPPIKETVVTPRQLMESPAVEVIGVMKHRS